MLVAYNIKEQAYATITNRKIATQMTRFNHYIFTLKSYDIFFSIGS